MEQSEWWRDEQRESGDGRAGDRREQRRGEQSSDSGAGNGGEYRNTDTTWVGGRSRSIGTEVVASKPFAHTTRTAFFVLGLDTKVMIIPLPDLLLR
jgi:hypothetical protein